MDLPPDAIYSLCYTSVRVHYLFNVILLPFSYICLGNNRSTKSGHPDAWSNGNDSFLWNVGVTGQPTWYYTLMSSASALLSGKHFECLYILSFRLPFPHDHQRLVNLGALNRGGAIAFCVPDPQFVIDDMRLSKSTFLGTVPRMLNKMYQAVMAREAGGGGPKGKLVIFSIHPCTNFLIIFFLFSWYSQRHYSIMPSK